MNHLLLYPTNIAKATESENHLMNMCSGPVWSCDDPVEPYLPVTAFGSKKYALL